MNTRIDTSSNSPVSAAEHVEEITPHETFSAPTVSVPSLLCDAPLCPFYDIGADVTRLMRKTAQTMERVSAAVRESARNLEAKANEDRVSAMRDQAMLNLVVGVVSGAATMASAGASMVSAARDLSASTKALTTAAAASKAPADAGLASAAKQAQANAGLVAKQGAVVSSAFKLGETATQLAMEGVKFAAAQKGIEVAEHETEAKGWDRLAQSAEESEAAAEKLAERALEFYRQWTQASVGALSASIGC